jgi:putative tryptophan/tyrosine transport system substrate-binding protein
MKRRDTILALLALGAAAGSAAVVAQTANLPRRIAILDDSHETSRAAEWVAFRKRLQDLGYLEGKGYVIEGRWARAQTEKMPALAAELVALKPDVIVATSTIAAIAAKRATSTVPIVYVGANDPVRTGLVTNFARPEGNLTGITIIQQDVVGKWLELLHEIAPKAKSLAFLTYIDNPGAMQIHRDLRENAKPLGMSVQALDGTSRSNVERAFETMARERMDGLVVSATATLMNQRQQIVQAAAHLRIPAIYARRDYVDAGGLMFYGAGYDAIYSRAADYVHRILQGTKPSELPFERASTFKLVLNLKSATALGLKIPETVRMRVDEIVQ